MPEIKKIWDFLLECGMTKAGAAGMMGNLQAESGLYPDRVEVLCLMRYAEIGKHYTDATYTAFVNDGTISEAEFLRPMGKQYGYGLAQWTSPGRKKSLYNYCMENKLSIGSLKAQLYHLIMELKLSYVSVWRTLTTTNDILTASNAVLMHFEMPADQGSSVQQTRYKYSKAIFDQMTGSTSATASDIIDIMRGWIGYSEANGKYKQIVDIYNAYGQQHGYPRGYRVPYGVAWCDVTVSAAFIKADAVDLIGGVECGVEEHIKIFRQNGIWNEDGNATPQPGWIICYNWDDGTQPNDGYADHIGLVESVSGGNFTVIEGNCDDAVKRRTIPVGWGYVRGFAMPKYAKQATQEPEKQPETPKVEENTGGISKTPKWVGKVTADALNVRTWAGTENPNIKSYPILKEGNLVDVCDTVKAKDGTPWLYVRIAGKYYGFVSSKYIVKA